MIFFVLDILQKKKKQTLLTYFFMSSIQIDICAYMLLLDYIITCT